MPKNYDHQIIYGKFRSLFGGKNLKLSLIFRNKSSLKVAEAKNFILKFCRGMLILDYLSKQFQIKSIILLRNPYDSIKSQMNFGAYSNIIGVNDYKISEIKLFPEWYAQYEHILETAEKQIVILAIKWCLNLIGVLNAEKESALLIDYKELISDPKKVYSKIKAFTGIKIGINKAAENHQQTSSSGYSGKKNKLNTDQINRIRDYLNQFGLNDFVMEDGDLRIGRILASKKVD